MKSNRSSGILLHLTSLPSQDGIGDMGPDAYQWVDFLDQCGCALWQVLPLGPTGFGDSPYQCFSAFAGNPYLISPVYLYEDGLINRTDLFDRPAFPSGSVLYGEVIPWKIKLLKRAFIRFQQNPQTSLHHEFDAFVEQEKEWLEDYTLFMAIKESQNGASWDVWDSSLRKRDAQTLQRFKKDFAENITFQAFSQFIFYRQWHRLHQYAKQKSISIIGDLPIFVSFDSSDTWSHPELFYMDAEGFPTVVAGVPPDYFSPTGQLWGNPLYRWEYHQQTKYAWWFKRIEASLSLFDILRLDHFRGFSAYWEVPAGSTTAIHGSWKQGPGAHFFQSLQDHLGNLPIIAEDLGMITKDVEDLRDQFDLPGMKVLQFAFSDDSSHPFLPHNYRPNCVAYTGTHDNDTCWGWYRTTCTDKEKAFLHRYLNCDDSQIAYNMIRAVWSSVAIISIAPLQDFLNLGSEARMNFPGKASGNWSWRVDATQINPDIAGKIRELNELFSRLKKEEKNTENTKTE